MSDELVAVAPEVTPTQEYWFCTPPTVEGVRAHIGGGRVIGYTYWCPHGSWDDLRAARDAHGRAIDVDVV